jgi:isoleucyl-tRNA synthetase
LLRWSSSRRLSSLPSNVALAVGKDIVYVRIKDGDDIYVLAKDRLPA